MMINNQSAQNRRELIFMKYKKLKVISCSWLLYAFEKIVRTLEKPTSFAILYLESQFDNGIFLGKLLHTHDR